MLSVNKQQRNLVLSVIASLLSLIFLAFGIRKRNSSFLSAKEWIYKQFGEKFDGQNDIFDEDLDFDHGLNPKFHQETPNSITNLSWRSDGSNYYIVYISKTPFPENFKVRKSYPSLIKASLSTKNFEFSYQQVYEFNYSTEWTRKIIFEVDEPGIPGRYNVRLLKGDFYVVIGSSKGTWSSYLSFPEHLIPKSVDLIPNLKVCYEKKKSYYLLHLIFGENYKNIACFSAHLLVKASTNEIYTYPIGELKECVTIKLKGSNGGLCYLHYFNDFEEPVIKYVDFLPQTFEFEDSNWYNEFLEGLNPIEN